MTVQAVPTVSVAGTTVGSDTLRAVEGLSLTWGRDSLLSHPTPARATVTLLDTSPARTFATRRDLIGQALYLGWSTGTATGRNFAGRVTDVQIARRDDLGGLLITLDATSLEVDAANYTVPAGTAWPGEAFSVRRDRIMGLFPAGLFAGAQLPNEWNPYTAAQVDAGGADGLSLLRQLLDSCGRALIFNPATGGFDYGRRRYLPLDGNLGRHAVGLELLSGAWQPTCFPVAGSALDAPELTMGDLAVGQQNRLTRVEVGYLDSANGWSNTTAAGAVTTTPGEAVIGRRTLTVDTLHAGAGAAGNVLGEWVSLVSAEGSLPHLEPVTFSTARSPFVGDGQAATILSGSETPTWLILRGSWLPQAGVPPTVGIIGGTVSYSGRDWSATLRLGPAVNLPAYNGQVPGLRARYAATDDTVRLRDMYPVLTLADLDHITVGAGYTAATMPT